jgi:hypothetical protein
MLIKTRAVVRALVLRRARLVDHLNSHPTLDVNADLDDSYRDLRTLATNSRWSTFLATTGALTLPVVPAITGETFAVIPAPTDAIQLRRLETSSGTRWEPAEECPLDQLRDVQRASTVSGGWVFRWTELDAGTITTEDADTGALVAGRIAICPIPGSGQYQLWYLPEFAGTTAESGAGGFYTYANNDFFEYHVCHCVVKLLTTDNDSQGMLTGWLALLGKYEARIMTSRPVAAGSRTWVRSRNYHAR